MTSLTKNFASVNRSALKKSNPKYLEWLNTASKNENVNVDIVSAKDGHLILTVNGQSQDSPRSPVNTANENFKNFPAVPPKYSTLWVFGFGSPYLLSVCLQKANKVMLLEPRATVVNKALEAYDFSQAIAKGQLVFLTPSDFKRQKKIKRLLAFIVHKPSERALKAHFSRYNDFTKNIDRDLITLSETLIPKILVIGPLSGGPVSMGPALLRAGSALGWPTRLVQWEEETLRLAQSALQPDFAATSFLFTRARTEILRALELFKPDLVIALAQAPLNVETILEFKTISPALWALWFVEDYRLFNYVTEVAPAYDLFFHIQGPLMDEVAKAWGLNRAYYLPPAADPDFFRPQKGIPPEFRALVSFMGAGYPNRRELMANLLSNYWLKSKRPINGFKIFGSGWTDCPEEVRARLFQEGRRISPEESSLIYAGTEVNLNIHSAHELGFHKESAFVNPRTFELAASGAFQLVDPRPLLPSLFSAEEVVTVEDPLELPDKIEYYLDRPKLRQEIGHAAREKVLMAHTYVHRLTFMVQKARRSFKA
ncbi:MAG: glycosyltransferase [Deltaproteobacteria bacterium]|jgi:spore maturation protein CgeB|nr:glycosyltransferase [Deltaproteobacteria bacterium]